MNTIKLPALIRSILAARRKSRIKFILSKINIKDNMKIIDIGCGPDGRAFDDFIPLEWSVTGIDLIPKEKVNHKHPNFNYIQADGERLSMFSDKEYDLAISIGMLEHITDEEKYQRIVGEIRRVSKQYIIIVPYKYAWIEPHFGFPFFQLFPLSMKIAISKFFNLANCRKILKEYPNFIKDNYRWLSNSQYLKSFTDGSIYMMPSLETIAIVKKSPL